MAYIHSEKGYSEAGDNADCKHKGGWKSPGTSSGRKRKHCSTVLLIGYIHYEAPIEEQNFSTLIEFLNAMEVREDDEEFQNPVDMMFEALEKKKPDHFAVRQYKK